jgi:hypothetical protein
MGIQYRITCRTWLCPDHSNQYSTGSYGSRILRIVESRVGLILYSPHSTLCYIFPIIGNLLNPALEPAQVAERPIWSCHYVFEVTARQRERYRFWTFSQRHYHFQHQS